MKLKDLNVIFMGTPEFAVPILEVLNEHTKVVLVVTQPDKPVGRKKILTASPIKEYALQNAIPVYQPTKIRREFQKIVDTPCDLIVTCAYGQFIPKEILDYPRLGCINVHASLLPKYRGGAPIHWCLINGEEKTGITVMYMDEKMDAGDLIYQKEYSILETDTVETLHQKLSALGAKALLEVLPAIAQKTNKRIKQNEEEVTFGLNVTREDERLDFAKTGRELLNQIRGLNSWPLANFLLEDQECKVFEGYFEKKSGLKPGEIVSLKKDAIGISCADGILFLTKIKPFGKKSMDVKSFLNGMDKDHLLKSKIN